VSELLFTSLNFWAILIGALFCWPAGKLIDRLGSRGVLTGVALALGLAVLGMSAATSVALLFVLLTLVRGLGQGALSVVSMALVGKWFTRRLGLAMGVLTVLLAVGFIATILLVGTAVREASWRAAWSGIGLALVLGLAPLGWLLARSTPESCGLAPDRGPDATDKPPRPDVSTWDALRSPAFWVFTVSTSLFNLSWSAITLLQQPILEARGFAGDVEVFGGRVSVFVLVMAVLTASGLPANLLGGWLATRWPMGRLLGVGMVFLGVSLFAFPLLSTVPHVVLYAVTLGVSGGLLTVVHFAIYGYAFGRSHLGQIQGVAQVVSVFASAVGPVLLAACHQATGAYDPIFFGTAPLAAALGVCAWFVRLPRAGAPGSQEGEG
jgi:MFS family permease